MRAFLVVFGREGSLCCQVANTKLCVSSATPLFSMKMADWFPQSVCAT